MVMGTRCKTSNWKLPRKIWIKRSYNHGSRFIKGISTYIDLDVIEVPGATAYFDTNYQNKVDYALESLKTHDVQFIHIEAPDEAGHEGNLPEK